MQYINVASESPIVAILETVTVRAGIFGLDKDMIPEYTGDSQVEYDNQTPILAPVDAPTPDHHRWIYIDEDGQTLTYSQIAVARLKYADASDSDHEEGNAVDGQWRWYRETSDSTGKYYDPIYRDEFINMAAQGKAIDVRDVKQFATWPKANIRDFVSSAKLNPVFVKENEEEIWTAFEELGHDEKIVYKLTNVCLVIQTRNGFLILPDQDKMPDMLPEIAYHEIIDDALAFIVKVFVSAIFNTNHAPSEEIIQLAMCERTAKMFKHAVGKAYSRNPIAIARHDVHVISLEGGLITEYHAPLSKYIQALLKPGLYTLDFDEQHFYDDEAWINTRLCSIGYTEREN